MTRYHPAVHDPVVRHLFQCRLSDEQIGERIGVSGATVCRQRERLGLGRPRYPGAHAKPSPEPLPPAGPEPTNPVQIARQTLGRRATEKGGCYRLDGTPVSAPDLVRAANRVRLKEGRPQFGPQAWRVTP